MKVVNIDLFWKRGHKIYVIYTSEGALPHQIERIKNDLIKNSLYTKLDVSIEYLENWLDQEKTVKSHRLLDVFYSFIFVKYSSCSRYFDSRAEKLNIQDLLQEVEKNIQGRLILIKVQSILQLVLKQHAQLIWIILEWYQSSTF